MINTIYCDLNQMFHYKLCHMRDKEQTVFGHTAQYNMSLTMLE